MTPTKSSDFHLYFGDFAYFMKMKFHFNMTMSLSYSMCVLSCLFHYYDYLCDRTLYENIPYDVRTDNTTIDRTD